MDKYLAPSILSANFYDLKSDFYMLKNNGIRYVHLDVMDGMFVPNISFGIPVIKKIKQNTKNDFILDTHLMVERPERYITNFKEAGSDILTIHAEATIDFDETLSMIKSCGMKAGISINPETDIKKIDTSLEICDLVLIMSVHPGFGGQSFINETLNKVIYLKEKREKIKNKFMIEIDGGVNFDNINKISKAGVDIIVAGSAVFKGDIDKNIKSLMEKMNE